MYILGISGGVRPGNQDSAAALIKDNEIVAAAEEERFIRVKHAPGVLPENAIRYCLKQGGIGIKDVDYVVFPGATYENFTQLLTGFFEFRFKYSPKVRLIDHHLAHAASAYYLSGFDKSMIITMDLSGDNRSTTLSMGENGKTSELAEFRKPNSIGLFYSVITEYLGFQYDTDEYKVMGLSAYGEPTINLDWLLNSDAQPGTYRFDHQYTAESIKPGASHPSRQLQLGSSGLWKRLGYPRRSGEPILKHHEDLAASAQRKLEKAAKDLVIWLHDKTGCNNLSVAGGVGLNCVMNQRLKALPFVDKIFIQPAAGDAGLALGTALLVAVENGYRFSEMKHAFYGPDYSDAEVEQWLKTVGAPYMRCDDIAKLAAENIAAGKIVGWFQSRMEFGPRALGARSILADPRDAGMKDKVNELVKFREEFRPFAPAVLADHSKDFFVDATDSPFMILTFDVIEEMRKIIPAVVHVDGTARVQTVDSVTNPLFYRLIKEFHKKTGVPVVLNTSFNIKGQPIVLNPQQAISTFYGTGMDCLAIGNYFVMKKE